jgi:uncharacterized damage-inducible protein DinB
MNERRTLIVDPSLGTEPLIGMWLWAITDARQRTTALLEDQAEVALDWLPDDRRIARNSIGSLLYHIALIEADWLCAEVLELDESNYPPALMALFPYPDRDTTGNLAHVTGIGLTEHLERLNAVRTEVLRIFAAMDLAEFQRVRHLPRYDVTPAWVLHHLLQHEAEHRSEIAALSNALRDKRRDATL